MYIDRLAILGVGLIGGSLARALRSQNACGTVVGFGRSEDRLKIAVELGVIDEYSLDAAEVVKDADVIVLATPLLTIDSLLEQIKGAIKEGAVITDVGSAKGCVVESANKILTSSQLKTFVPGHPIAGTEKTGVEASFTELFEDHLVILTPTAEADGNAYQQVRNMWELTGARVVDMEVGHHDAILASTSHLPHLLAYALVDCLAGKDEREEIFKYAAGGFADFTRIASSSPQMWHDVCFSNKQSLLQVLEHFDKYLMEIKKAIEQGDSEGLLKIFTRAKKARDEFAQKRSAAINLSGINSPQLAANEK